MQRRYEAHHGVRITDAALVAAAQMSDRYMPDRHLPDKAIDLVDEAAAKVIARVCTACVCAWRLQGCSMHHSA